MSGLFGIQEDSEVVFVTADSEEGSPGLSVSPNSLTPTLGPQFLEFDSEVPHDVTRQDVSATTSGPSVPNLEEFTWASSLEELPKLFETESPSLELLPLSETEPTSFDHAGGLPDHSQTPNMSDLPSLDATDRSGAPSAPSHGDSEGTPAGLSSFLQASRSEQHCATSVGEIAKEANLTLTTPATMDIPAPTDSKEKPAESGSLEMGISLVIPVNEWQDVASASGDKASSVSPTESDEFLHVDEDGTDLSESFDDGVYGASTPADSSLLLEGGREEEAYAGEGENKGEDAPMFITSATLQLGDRELELEAYYPGNGAFEWG